MEFDQVARESVALSPEEQFDAARELSLFEEFTIAELKQVLGVAISERFAAGKSLVTESEKLMKESTRQTA